MNRAHGVANVEQTRADPPISRSRKLRANRVRIVRQVFRGRRLFNGNTKTRGGRGLEGASPIFTKRSNTRNVSTVAGRVEDENNNDDRINER